MDKVVNELMDHVDDVSRRGIGDFHPTVLDIYGHGWRQGLSDSTIEEAIVRTALRARSIVCCPLGALDAAATIIPNLPANGAAAEDVRGCLGNPDARDDRAGGSYRYYGLPYVGGRDPDGDWRTYSERHQEWSPTPDDPHAPPFAPLHRGERMFHALQFIDEVLVRSWVTVLSEGDLEKLTKP